MAGRLLAHYPERLGRAVILDAPRFFSATWVAVSKVVNTTTAAKVMFARTDDGSFDTELGTWAGGPLKQWLLAEIAENRLKQYQHGEKEYWSASADVSAHDPRALAAFAASPEFALVLTHRVVAGPAAGAAAGAGQANGD